MGPPDRDPRDEAWFGTIYTDFYPNIVRYGVRRLPDAESAREPAQDVFVITWRRRAEVPEPPLPWLYGVRGASARLAVAGRDHRPGRPDRRGDQHHVRRGVDGTGAGAASSIGSELRLIFHPETGELLGSDRVRPDGLSGGYRMCLGYRMVGESGQPW